MCPPPICRLSHAPVCLIDALQAGTTGGWAPLTEAPFAVVGSGSGGSGGGGGAEPVLANALRVDGLFAHPEEGLEPVTYALPPLLRRVEAEKTTVLRAAALASLQGACGGANVLRETAPMPGEGCVCWGCPTPRCSTARDERRGGEGWCEPVDCRPAAKPPRRIEAANCDSVSVSGSGRHARKHMHVPALARRRPREHTALCTAHTRLTVLLATCCCACCCRSHVGRAARRQPPQRHSASPAAGATRRSGTAGCPHLRRRRCVCVCLCVWYLHDRRRGAWGRGRGRRRRG